MMEMLADVGLSADFLHWFLAVALTLLVIDIFTCTEILSYASLAIFAAWGTWMTGAPLQWSVLVFIIYAALGVAFYYLCWAKIVRPWVMKLCFGHSSLSREAAEALVGQTGTVIGEGEEMYLRVLDELWAVDESCRAGFANGDRARITAYDRGVVCIEKV